MDVAKPGGHQVYRKEIDGLRALAVLPVLFFHFSVPGFQGGFVGVDIFFVISGFLIGGILWSEFERTGRLRLGHFFMRRIRRLAPAYFSMAIVSLIFAYFILLPFEFREFGKELIASTVYVSNVHFFREAGYFDGLAEYKVLLHTWSLSVEEQFYIFLPVLLLLLRRVRWHLPFVLLGILIVSLVACLVVTPLSQTATFYLFPFRAWELLAGVCLAVMGQKYTLNWSFNGALSWAGVALIAGSVAFIPAGENFPGVLAVFPVLGAVLVISNGLHDNWVNRALSHPGLVFFGLISYSLYLWHWPIMSLSKYAADSDQTAVIRALLIAVSIAVAWLSLRFVETPVRRGTWRTPVVLGTAGAASMATLGAGAVIYLQDGMIDRFAPRIRTHIEASADFLQDWSRCETPSDGDFAGLETCPIGPEGAPRLLIWGDSHVRAFKEGLEQAAFDADVPALIIWRAGCPPLFGIEKEENTSTRIQNEACGMANRQIEKALAARTNINTLLLIGRWSYYAEGLGTGENVSDTIRLFATEGGPLEATGHGDLLAAAINHTADVMAERVSNVFFLRQVPEITGYNSRTIARRLAHGHLTDPVQIDALTSVPRPEAEARMRRADTVLQEAGRLDRVQVLDSWDGVCSQASCSAMHDGVAGYFDNNHITNRTAIRLRGLFAPAFESVQ